MFLPDKLYHKTILYDIIACMKINVIYNKEISGYAEVLNELEKVLSENPRAEFKSFNIDEMEAFGEFTFVIGGDGTLLRAAVFYSGIPVLGINLGRLGFLAQAGVGEIQEAVNAVINGKYSIEERLMLSSKQYLALNDFVIKGCTPSRTSKFYLEINGKFVCDYIADGLIISTPTGSTAYGLSAGGPVLYPDLEAFVIVPICPHTLNVRPLVVPAYETITVKTSDRLLSVAADGLDTAECVKEISIHKSEKKAMLAFLDDDSFYSVLRNKLHWGFSPDLK